MPDFMVKSPVLTGQFTAAMTVQAEDANANAMGNQLLRQRVWCRAADPSGWSGDPLDVPGMAGGFPRGQPEALYLACLYDPVPGSAGEAAARHLEHDRIAAQERAFRLRHLSPIRAAAHATARSRGHGDPRGLFGFAVGAYVQGLLTRGAS